MSTYDGWHEVVDVASPVAAHLALGVRLRAPAAWGLAFAVLGAMFADQVANFAAGWFNVPALVSVVAAFALLVPLMLGRGPYPVRLGLLALQALAVFAPFLVLGAEATPVFTLGSTVAAGVLLTLPATVRWPVFALVVLAHVAATGSVVEPESGPVGLHAVTFGLGDVYRGLILFALARLAQYLRLQQECGLLLSELFASRERLRLGGELRAAVTPRLTTLLAELRHIRAELSADRTADRAMPQAGPRAAARLAAVADLARQASGVSRTLVDANRSGPVVSASDMAPAPDPAASLRLARRIMLALLVTTVAYEARSLYLTGGRETDRGVTAELLPAAPAAWLVAAVLLPTIIALHMYHGAPRAAEGAPRAWPWTLALHALAVAGVAAITQATMPAVVMLFTGVLLVRPRPPWSWAALGVVIVGIAGPYQDLVASDHSLGDRASAAMVTFFSAVAVYALCRLPEATRRLHATREEVALMAVLTERLRMNQDLHDLLGFHLSTLSLKAELALRLLEDDPDRARDQVEELVTIAERALGESRTLAGEPAVLCFCDELAVVRSVLEAAAVRIHVDAAPMPLPGATDHLFAVVLREATTNILRHAKPTRVTIDTSYRDDAVWLRISNDGATPATPPGPPASMAPSAPTAQPGGPTTPAAGGAGLTNLAGRLDAAGGTLTVRAVGDTFTLVARVPDETPADDEHPAAGARPASATSDRDAG